MKKLSHFLLVSLLALFLTACNIQTVEQFEQMEDQDRSADSLPTSEQPEAEEQTPSVENDTAEEKQEVKESEIDDKAPLEAIDTALQQKAQQETEEVKQQPKSEADKKQEYTKSPSTKTTKQADNKQQTKTITSSTEKQKNAEPKKRTVKISIRVDTLLKHWEKLDPSLQSEKYVPKNGIILKTTTYELLSEKDTVWDVLQRATKEHKIQMEYQGANENIYNSVYVEGINHLYEFSAGELSGWMYRVNGVYPNYGCNQYVLKDGDVIEWNYTVDLGRDLGHHWDGN
ncbi:DUF4430 domain-containing protein [Lysinibacillus mangiferihumi]|uniref:DUF4430 domain-containing protein n=1 Tax=Lysinibacillus mangiferihumi TaxID=1130819 RepID=A0A4U2YYQ0_9BACI|nr:DUF4430 domain-containing protein [Lysinibacillus mangiferihumi]TKI66300.1 DUF4430 domain-containing protein [Lysinibacillus mangiferihumi]